MVSKHITRDYSAHRKSVIRPYDEYCGLEIFSFDPTYTRVYLPEHNTLTPSNNGKRTSWKSWACYKANTPTEDIDFNLTYNVTVDGDYRIDLLYEQNSYIHSNSKYNTSKDLTGDITIMNGTEEVYENLNLKFDGEDNVIKRIPLYFTFNQGVHDITFGVPPNCYFMGVIIRKIVKYTANNYFGADAGKDSGNMMFTSASLSISDMTKPSELQVEVGYDDAYECYLSPSGFYIDFMDEVNFYVKDNDGVIEQVFGGYVSSILPDNDRTKLTIHCADRLVDGQNKYILDSMEIQDGTSTDSSYTKELTKQFKNYAHALKYLCDLYEVTLKSNISANYLIEGEKYSDGLTITFGKNKSVKKIKAVNGSATPSKNFITLRNNADSSKEQSFTLYNAKDVAKLPPDITSKGYLHLTYGMGSTVTTEETKKTTTVDTTDTTAGTQRFTKCGVSEDKKYVMFIGKASVNETVKKYGYTNLYKVIFENKCPYCGKATLRYDDGSRNNCITNNGHSGNKTDVPEGEITCHNCDMDFDGLGGKEKISGSKYRLKRVTTPVKSSISEKNQLIAGKMKAIPKTGTEITPDSIFKAITNLAFKYKYVRGATGQTYSQMKKTGHGDCWGFSDLIFTELKKYGVTCKIVKYSTNYSDEHRSVLYKNAKKQWTDFPYREYGWDKKYHNNLNNTSKSKTAKTYQSYKGTNIGNVTVKSKTTSKQQTTTIKTTHGYDTSKPFNAYLKITYSTEQSFTAPKKSVLVKFTQSAVSGDTINDKGFIPYWVNNDTKRITPCDSDNKPLDLIYYIKGRYPSISNVYLQSIQFITSKNNSDKTTTSGDTKTEWYTSDKTNIDNSSCKMDLYQLTFDNNPEYSNPTEWNTCGKSVLSMIQQLSEETDYLVDMDYGYHRKDDKINFRINNHSNSSFTASEGDNNNILNWNSISYSPISSLYNMSMQVFKEGTSNKYRYIDSRIPTSILQYGEQCTIETRNETMGVGEAYFNARMNPKFNGEQTYTYTITVPNYPSLRLGEYVEVIANAKKLNSIKEVKSLKITFDMSKMPRIQTEIGLDELAPDIQLRENIRNMRRQTKEKTTEIGKSATPIIDEMYFEWDR